MTEHSNNNYNKNLREFARKLRNNSTLAEVILWDKVLKKKQLRGYPFLRQRPIGNYIVDFFCKELKLIIELEGEIHKFQKNKDNVREENIRKLGYSMIKFDNSDVLNAFLNVERTLHEFIDRFEEQKSPLNSPQGGI